MANEEYIDELINPEPQGSAISGSIGQAASTLGMFMGIHLVGMFIFKKGKMSAFSALSKSKVPRIKAAAETVIAAKDHSLTNFISQVGGTQPRGLSAVAKTIYEASVSKSVGAIKGDWKGLATIDRFRKFRGLNTADKTAVMVSNAAKYGRDAAAFFPLFYIAEHNIGIIGEGPEKKHKPAWYNLPGHAVEFAKFVPHMLAIDLGFRGVMQGAKMAASPLRGMLDPIEQAIASSPISDAAVSAYKWMARGAYRDKQIAGMKIGDIIDSTGAAKDAYTQSLKSPTRLKMWRGSKETFSGYQRTTESFYDVYASHKKNIKSLYSKAQSNRATAYKKRIARENQTTEEAFSDNFSDFVKFMSDKGVSARTDYQEALWQSNRAAEGSDLIGKQFYNQNFKKPFIARILGLRRAQSSDYKASRNTLGKLYDKILTDNKKWHTSSKVLGKNKEDFMSKLLSNNTFLHERTGLTVNLDHFDPRHWMAKSLSAMPTIMGFSVADLYPIKVMLRRDTDPAMHRVMLARGQVPLTPAQQTDAFGRKLFTKQIKDGVDTVSFKNVYNFSSEYKDGSVGLLMRRAGDKRYSLWDFQGGSKGANVAGGWVQVGQNIKMALRTDSPKGQRIHQEGLVSSTDKKLDGIGNQFHTNPLIRFMQEKLSLMDNKGTYASVFRKLQMVMPDGMQKAFGIESGAREARARNIIKDLKGLSKHKVDDIVTSKVETNHMMGILQRTKALSAKIRKRSFDSTLSDDYFFNTVVGFLRKETDLLTDKATGFAIKIRNTEDVFDLAMRVRRSAGERGMNERELMRIDTLLEEARLSKNVLRREVHPELPVEKLKRFIYDYSVEFSYVEKKGAQGVDQRILKKAAEAFRGNRISRQQVSDVEFTIFSNEFSEVINATKFKQGKAYEKLEKDDVASVLEGLNNFINKRSVLQDGTVLDNAAFNTGYFEQGLSKAFETGVPDIIDTLQLTMNSNPWVAYPSNLKDMLGFGGRWVTSTVGKLVSFAGLGWDQGVYNSPGKVAALQAKRLATFGAGLVGYSALDTFTDASGLFDGTMLDEGITVAAADQAVRVRLLSAKTYDVLGVDNVARYMEGLMPGSMNVLPGALVGGVVGGLAGAGLKGAAIGALVNAYLGPQLREGPLSFLAAVPPLAPFVSDLTKSYEEVQDIYEGKELIARRKGAGWTLGQTPIEGGRIEGWELHWYPKLKSQYKASPVLYGSKVEQFLAKDVPLLDFSLMDIIDPQYLTYKHYEDRPYLLPDTPFSEVPVIGPILGASLGRAYNLVHPLGQVDPMHVHEAATSFMQGKNYDWKGSLKDTYGPQYLGLGPAGIGATEKATGEVGGLGNRVLSPYDIKPLISESIYKGWIEWFGLPGFITSATLWDGDEPFTDIPIASAATDMDSFARTYWDSNVGDMALTNELMRRFVPRPRTSYETVDLIHNAMPTWMPEHLRSGDPYCLLPDTLVETTDGLVKSVDIETGTLVKTMYGRYYPVSNTVSRPVKEDIYCITLPGLSDYTIKVTGEHPFYVKQGKDYEWILAKDLTKEDRVCYPLLQVEFDEIVNDDSNLELKTTTAKLLGLLARWTTLGDSLDFREEISSSTLKEIEKYIEILDVDLTSIASLVYEHQKDGPSIPIIASNLALVLNYLEPFRIKSNISQIQYRFHTQQAAYSTWVALIQNKIFSFIEGDTLIIKDTFAAEIAYLLDLDIKVNKLKTPYCSFSLVDTKIGPVATLTIESIEKEFYDGKVYTIEVSDDATYCLPGAIVHNSKIAHGELYLPGAGYEAAFNPDLTFPVGMSRLGRSAYEQALGMIGLSDITEAQEEIMDKGTAIHQMVQNQLTMMGEATRVEALVSNPEANLRSYVDVLLKDQRGNDLPLEIKSISDKGFAKLDRPKFEHRIQLNSYMAALGVNRGKFLYVAREDPSKTKQFSMTFDPDLWQQTLGQLREARSLAQEFLAEGYGAAAPGYSYMDRARVLLNAAPYSKEYRETADLLLEQSTEGYLTDEENEQFSTLQKYHKAMMRKYEMYPRRFTLDKLMDPDAEYLNLSTNENIRPADTYSLAERIAGASWEYATHLRSPLHSKLIGRYSPEEQYDRKALYGVPFQSWAKPYETFLKPYARGLISVTDPLQGSSSFAVGGLLFGGAPGALAGAAIGGAYGTMHGLYRAISGDTYKPDSFREKIEMQEYFDTIEYIRAEQMYMATGNPEYKRQMLGTMRGWIESGGGQFMNVPRQSLGGYEYNPGSLNFGHMQGPMGSQAREMNNPYAQGVGYDQGFGSPWKGIKGAMKLAKGDVRVFRGLDTYVRGSGAMHPMHKGGKFVGSGKKDFRQQTVKNDIAWNRTQTISEDAAWVSTRTRTIETFGGLKNTGGVIQEFHIPRSYFKKHAIPDKYLSADKVLQQPAGPWQRKALDYWRLERGFYFEEGIPISMLKATYRHTGFAKYQGEKAMLGVRRKRTEALISRYNSLKNSISAKASAMNKASRLAHNPVAKGVGSDKGFGSPWQGIDDQEALNYDPNINIFSAFSALPSWDRPFWSAFLETPEEKQEDLLQRVDERMADMLKIAWGRGEEVTMPDMDTYFQHHKRPSAVEPIMGPDFNTDDYLTVTANERGMDAHDFGIGWRSQLQSIKQSATAILPINIDGADTPRFKPSALSPSDIKAAIGKVLDRMGYAGATIQVNAIMSEREESVIRLNVKREASSDIIEQMYG